MKVITKITLMVLALSCIQAPGEAIELLIAHVSGKTVTKSFADEDSKLEFLASLANPIIGREFYESHFGHIPWGNIPKFTYKNTNGGSGALKRSAAHIDIVPGNTQIDIMFKTYYVDVSKSPTGVYAAMDCVEKFDLDFPGIDIPLGKYAASDFLNEVFRVIPHSEATESTPKAPFFIHRVIGVSRPLFKSFQGDRDSLENFMQKMLDNPELMQEICVIEILAISSGIKLFEAMITPTWKKKLRGFLRKLVILPDLKETLNQIGVSLPVPFSVNMKFIDCREGCDLLPMDDKLIQFTKRGLVDSFTREVGAYIQEILE